MVRQCWCLLRPGVPVFQHVYHFAVRAAEKDAVCDFHAACGDVRYFLKAQADAGNIGVFVALDRLRYKFLQVFEPAPHCYLICFRHVFAPSCFF